MAPFVDLGVDCGGAHAAWMLRHNDLGAMRVEIGNDFIAVESLVGPQRAVFDTCNQWGNAYGIEAVARQRKPNKWPASLRAGILVVMPLGAAYGLPLCLPFAP